MVFKVDVQINFPNGDLLKRGKKEAVCISPIDERAAFLFLSHNKTYLRVFFITRETPGEPFEFNMEVGSFILPNYIRLQELVKNLIGMTALDYMFLMAQNDVNNID